MEEEDQELAEKIRTNPHEYIAELKKFRGGDVIRRGYAHEVGSKLTVIKNIGYILKSEIESLTEKLSIPREEIEKIYANIDLLERNSNQLNSISQIIHISSLNKSELQKNQEWVNLEELVRENILAHQLELEKSKIKVLYCYDCQNNTPIKTYFNRAALTILPHTLMTNLLRHAQEGSLSKQGLKIKDGNLEYIIENHLGGSRDEYGMNTKVGLKLVERIVGEMGGKVGLYEIPKDYSKYEFKEFHGYKDEVNKVCSEDEKVFGVKIKFPFLEPTMRPLERS